MKAALGRSTRFAFLRREANEGGYFRPEIKEVVERPAFQEFVMDAGPPDEYYS